jgi:hypothetical protein
MFLRSLARPSASPLTGQTLRRIMDLVKNNRGFGGAPKPSTNVIGLEQILTGPPLFCKECR